MNTYPTYEPGSTVWLGQFLDMERKAIVRSAVVASDEGTYIVCDDPASSIWNKSNVAATKMDAISIARDLATRHLGRVAHLLHETNCALAELNKQWNDAYRGEEGGAR